MWRQPARPWLPQASTPIIRACKRPGLLPPGWLGVTAPVNGPGLGGASYNPYASNEPPAAPIAIAPGYFADRWRCIVQPGDTVRSLLYWNANNGSGGPLTGSQTTYGGDLRIGQLTPVVNGSTDFREHPGLFRRYPVSRLRFARRGRESLFSDDWDCLDVGTGACSHGYFDDSGSNVGQSHPTATAGEISRDPRLRQSALVGRRQSQQGDGQCEWGGAAA